MSQLTKRGAARKRDYVDRRVPRSATPAERFAFHLEPQPDGCWYLRLTPIPQTGYAGLTIDGKRVLAHRLSYELHIGPIPDGMQIDHVCRVRRCVNPDHLEAVTPQENVLRGESPGAVALRRMECEFGHAFAIHGRVRHGRRICRICRMEYSRAYHRLTPAERLERRDAGLPMVDLTDVFGRPMKQVAA